MWYQSRKIPVLLCQPNMHFIEIQLARQNASVMSLVKRLSSSSSRYDWNAATVLVATWRNAGGTSCGFPCALIEPGEYPRPLEPGLFVIRVDTAACIWKDNAELLSRKILIRKKNQITIPQLGHIAPCHIRFSGLWLWITNAYYWKPPVFLH